MWLVLLLCTSLPEPTPAFAATGPRAELAWFSAFAAPADKGDEHTCACGRHCGGSCCCQPSKEKQLKVATQPETQPAGSTASTSVCLRGIPCGSRDAPAASASAVHSDPCSESFGDRLVLDVTVSGTPWIGSSAFESRDRSDVPTDPPRPRKPC